MIKSQPSLPPATRYARPNLPKPAKEPLLEKKGTVHRAAPPVAAPSGPPDLSQLTPEQQYNYLQTVVTQAADGQPEAWKTGPNEVNLIGVRSYVDGQPVLPEGNAYNDTIYAAWVDEQGQQHVEPFHGSTDAGVVADPKASGFGYTDAQGNYQGFSHLADGFYPDTWVKGDVPNSDLGLRQSGNIRINVDSNNDGIIQDEEKLGIVEGAGWGIQFHPGGTRDKVGSWSAGCQVIRPEEYDAFKDVLNMAANQSFSYTLVDGSNLPPIDGNVAAPQAFVPGYGTTNGTRPPSNGNASWTPPARFQSEAVQPAADRWIPSTQESAPAEPSFQPSGDTTDFSAMTQYFSLLELLMELWGGEGGDTGTPARRQSPPSTGRRGANSNSQVHSCPPMPELQRWAMARQKWG